MKRKLFWILGILFALSIIGNIGKRDRPSAAAPDPGLTKDAVTTAPESKPVPKERTSRPQNGELGRIDSPGSDVGLALTDASYAALTKAAAAKDRRGYMEEFLAGRAVPVPHGTRVQVIEVGWVSRKVRILEGPHSGKAGWVPMEFVVK